MKKIIILDHSTGITYILDYEEAIYGEFQSYLDYINEKYDLSLRESECSYMTTPDLTIKFL